MSLNPHHHFSASAAAAAAASSAPVAKLTFNVNAFNGNTTNFNRNPQPSAKALIAVPVQPSEFPMYRTARPGSIMPM
jgi:hypothetical protein